MWWVRYLVQRVRKDKWVYVSRHFVWAPTRETAESAFVIVLMQLDRGFALGDQMYGPYLDKKDAQRRCPSPKKGIEM